MYTCLTSGTVNPLHCYLGGQLAIVTALCSTTETALHPNTRDFPIGRVWDGLSGLDWRLTSDATH